MPTMPLPWPDSARLPVDAVVFCHDTDCQLWRWEAVVVSVEPPAIGISLPQLETVVFARLEWLHGDTPEPNVRCRYCRAVDAEWTE
jgi:hypothetical protein